MALPSHEEFEREHRQRHPEGGVPGCYACKLDGVGIQFTYGKAAFHGETIAERQAEHHAACEAQGKKLGRDYEPVWKR